MRALAELPIEQHYRYKRFTCLHVLLMMAASCGLGNPIFRVLFTKVASSDLDMNSTCQLHRLAAINIHLHSPTSHEFTIYVDGWK